MWTNGVIGKMTDTQVSSQIQILPLQLMRYSIAAIGQCGKHCVTLNNKGIVSEILTQDWNGSFLSQLIKSILLCNFVDASSTTSTKGNIQQKNMILYKITNYTLFYSLINVSETIISLLSKKREVDTKAILQDSPLLLPKEIFVSQG